MLRVPVPVRSCLGLPCSRTVRSKSRYCRIPRATLVPRGDLRKRRRRRRLRKAPRAPKRRERPAAATARSSRTVRGRRPASRQLPGKDGFPREGRRGFPLDEDLDLGLVLQGLDVIEELLLLLLLLEEPRDPVLDLVVRHQAGVLMLEQLDDVEPVLGLHDRRDLVRLLER